MNQEVKALLKKAKESIRAAELLNRQGFHDYSASRAYYAMLYIAQALLLSEDLSYSSHSAVQSAFGREFAKPGKLERKFHRWLIDAQDYRNQGDYGIQTHLNIETADKLCEWAHEFLASAQVYLQSTS